MNPDTTLKQLLEKYENGNCSTEEKETLHEYFDSFQDTEDIWKEIGIDKRESIHNEIFQNVDLKIGEETQSERLKRNSYWRIAASIVLIVGLGLIANLIYTNESDVAIVTKTTTNGQKITLKLPDGTKVSLNSGSKLSYPEAFSNIREVKLVGEAFFEVTKNQNKKFVVSTGDVTTTVLGTSFNLSAYPNEELRVTVETGKVGVKSNDQGIELDPGQQATYQGTTNKTLVKSLIDIGDYTSWRNGVLKFKDNTLSEIAAQLERWYGVNIEFDSEQGDNCNLKLIFDNQSLEQVLEQLEIVTGVNADLNDNLVKITGVGCKN